MLILTRDQSHELSYQREQLNMLAIGREEEAQLLRYLRDLYKDYFMSGGAVEWQENYSFGFPFRETSPVLLNTLAYPVAGMSS